MDTNEINGHLLLMMAPSGSGKKSLIDSVLAEHHDIYFAKTYTTRAIRQGTKENPLYMFTTREHFEEMMNNKDLIEWAEYSGNYYGTPKSEIIEPLRQGKIVFKEMELQGVQQMRELVPAEHRTVVYVDAGSWEHLERRIKARAPISDEELALRKKRYETESQSMDKADIIIQNHDGKLPEATAHLEQIVDSIVKRAQ
jgi:guanylate kinase